jgi:hypothetical protein
LIDEGHASLVGDAVVLLTSHGWDVRLEVSFSSYGDRGSIDVLGWHPQTQMLVVGEVKTEITSVEETLRRHDGKVRLGARIARDRFGWTSRAVTGLLILPDVSTARRRIIRHDVIFSRAYPVRGTRLRAWLRDPGVIAGALIFLSPTRGVRGIRHSRARRRIHRPPTSSGVAAVTHRGSSGAG